MPRPSFHFVEVSSVPMLIRRLAAPALISLAVIVASLAPMAPGVRAAIPPESDIPGIVFSGPVVTGRLGGPIYDVVYRVDVQPGYVIVAGLSGTAGTDFDLYLFNSTATTVLSNQGLLAKSTGPASAETLSYPSFAGGTYYIDLNGATDVEGTYALTVQLVPDQSAPIASLLLADGRPTTNSTTVKVRLTAYAGLAGIAQMAFSPDGIAFTAWESYTIETTWTFPVGDGTKTLWAKVRSGTGVEFCADSGLIRAGHLAAGADDSQPGARLDGRGPAAHVHRRVQRAGGPSELDPARARRPYGDRPARCWRLLLRRVVPEGDLPTER